MQAAREALHALARLARLRRAVAVHLGGALEQHRRLRAREELVLVVEQVLFQHTRYLVAVHAQRLGQHRRLPGLEPLHQRLHHVLAPRHAEDVLAEVAPQEVDALRRHIAEVRSKHLRRRHPRRAGSLTASCRGRGSLGPARGELILLANGPFAFVGSFGTDRPRLSPATAERPKQRGAAQQEGARKGAAPTSPLKSAVCTGGAQRCGKWLVVSDSKNTLRLDLVVAQNREKQEISSRGSSI